MKKFAVIAAVLVLIAAAAFTVITFCLPARTASVELVSNPTTGYRWYASQSEELFEITCEYVPDSTDPELVGGGGREIFTLKPLKTGKCDVTFVYQRAGSENAECDSVTWTVAVTLGKQIRVESMSANLAGTMDELPAIPEMKVS